MAETKVSPSLLAADFANLQRDVEMLNHSGADYIHIDIMDGRFVPNLSFGFPVTQAVQKHARIPLDFHLMIEEADPYLEECVKSGAAIITVHLEACRHLHRTVSQIRNLGAMAGVALNPHSDISLLAPVLPFLDLALVMSVNPGFGGQAFIETTYEKVRALRALAAKLQPSLIIEVDGGVNLETGKKLVEAGADMLVAGSFVFRSSDPVATVQSLKSL